MEFTRKHESQNLEQPTYHLNLVRGLGKRFTIGGQPYSPNWPRWSLEGSPELAEEIVDLGINYGRKSYEETGVLPASIDVIKQGNDLFIGVYDSFSKPSQNSNSRFN